MNEELKVKISISGTWQNPYRNGHYTQIDISVSNNTSSTITIQSIDIVCGNKSFTVHNDIVGHSILEPHSTYECKGNNSVFKTLEYHKCVSEDFYLSIKYTCGEILSNKLNISEPPICACQN